MVRFQFQRGIEIIKLVMWASSESTGNNEKTCQWMSNKVSEKEKGCGGLLHIG